MPVRSMLVSSVLMIVQRTALLVRDRILHLHGNAECYETEPTVNNREHRGGRSSGIGTHGENLGLKKMFAFAPGR